MLSRPYPVYVWMTSIALGPFMYFICSDFSSGLSTFIEQTLPFSILFFFAGFLVSLPSFFIYITLFLLLKTRSVLKAKILLCLCAVSCMFITFYLLVGKRFLSDFNENPFFNISVSYTISIILSSFFYKYGDSSQQTKE